MNMKRDFIRRAVAILTVTAAVIALAACNTDNVIVDPNDPQNDPLRPVITLDSDTGIYYVKAGRPITIAPTVEHADGAEYAWIVDGQTVGNSLTHTFTFDEPQTVYVTFCVTTSAGRAEEELRIEVQETAPPQISLALADDVLQLLPGAEYTFRPVIRNSGGDDFRCQWILDGVTVSDQTEYRFCEKELGRYRLTIAASNEDGEQSRDIDIEVVESLPRSVRFSQQSYMQPATDRYTVAGRPLYLTPLTENFTAPQFEWSVDGSVQSDADGETFRFVTDRTGDCKVSVRVTDADGSEAAAEVTVHCVKGADMRAKTSQSSRYQNKVYEYIPAPGQFINDIQTSGFTGSETSHEAAVAYAESRLEKRLYVSLGGFGGYLVVGFDHSIAAGSSGYDFAIQGNAFLSALGGSNEPGIVWVMQDTNGNGVPDDEWYELRGSESGSAGTLQNYSVTYFHPAGAKMSVMWRDSQGVEGTIDIMRSLHTQDFYYPQWIGESSYTLTGTRLEPKNTYDEATGFWHNEAYGWGYADNRGSDSVSDGDGSTGEGHKIGFRIANAMQADGSAVELKFIDFIKVQTALNTKSGGLGENSTEVISIEDLSM